MPKQKFKIIEEVTKKILLMDVDLRHAQEIIDKKGWRISALKNGKESEIFVVSNDC